MNNPTVAVNADIIRILAGIKEDIQKARQEGHARGALLETSVSEVSERLDTVEEKLKQFEFSIRQTSANKRYLVTEIQNIHKRLQGHADEIKEIRDKQDDKIRQVSDNDWKHESDIAATIQHVQKLEKSIWAMTIEFKKDPWVIIPAFLLIVGVGAFVWFGKISWEVGVGFVLTGGLMPAVLGRKNKKNVQKD